MKPAGRVCLFVFCTLLFDSAGRSQVVPGSLLSFRPNEETYSKDIIVDGRSAIFFLRFVCDKGRPRYETSVWDAGTG